MATRILIRQVSFPSFLRLLIEVVMLCGVFLAAGHVSLGLPLVDMLAPMVPVVGVMLLAAVFSGVFRTEINSSIINIYVHSAYGFLLAAAGFFLLLGVLDPVYSNRRFLFLFLFSAFFVINTVRPLISGTDFMDGGGRRGN